MHEVNDTGTGDGVSKVYAQEEKSLADRANRVRALSRGQLAHLVRQVGHKGIQNSLPPLTPQARASQAIPLSFAQQRLWYLEQLAPGTPTYNQYAALHLSGDLNIRALSQTFNEIIRRHDVLRTTFMVVDEQPVQIIVPPTDVSLFFMDLQALPLGERSAFNQELSAKIALHAFDISRGPLLYLILLRLGPQEHCLLLGTHHIVFDGWSYRVLFQELETLYDAFCQGQPVPLPDLPIQFADYAIWQRKWLHGEVLASQMAYWKQQLAGLPALLELPTDRPRPSILSTRGAVERLQVPPALTEALKDRSQEMGVTPFIVLLTAFKILLHHYSGQTDFCVGTLIAGRNHPATEGLIGLFINALAIRTQVTAQQSFREVILAVRDVCLAAYAHQDIPFEALVEALEHERSLSYTPLFQTLFVLQNTLLETVPKLRGMEVQPVKRDNHTAKYDLSLYLTEGAHEYTGYVEYNTDLFEAPTIRRLAGHFLRLLEGLVAHPDTRIGAFPLLSLAERQVLLAASRGIQADTAPGEGLHERFIAQASRTPDAVAIVCDVGQLSYRMVLQKATRVAQALTELGVAPEVRVGVCLERSPALIISLLGVLMAGGTYVPLDPSYPPARLAFMAKDVNMAVLLTQIQMIGRIASHGASILCLDAAGEPLSVGMSSEGVLPERVIHPAQAAYIIYTSGSTGAPKGVVIPHEAVCNTLTWLQTTFQLVPGDVVAQKTSISFTDSVWEIFWPLMVGAKLAILGDETVRDPHLLYDGLWTANVSITQFVPPQMLAFAEAVQARREPRPLPRLRWVFNGGEALPARTAATWYAACSQARIANIYGMTESAIYATYAPVTLIPDTGEPQVGIGQPIANASAYVVNTDRQLCPPPMPGEICIGGIGVARGYHHQPALTAQQFTPDHLSPRAGARLYRTGDQGRYDDDGGLIYLGRRDHQVQIRGFRVELGEVEAVLEQHPDITKAVVVSWEEDNDRRLVAYVVAPGPSASLERELRTFLHERVPAYMEPAAFVALERLPLTPHGKVDRGALPAPNWAQPRSETEWVGPRTPTEEAVAAIWREVLRREDIGVHDDFFAMGGHSLMGVRILARLYKAFGIELSLRALFEMPTVAQLAHAILRCQDRSEQDNTLALALTKLTEPVDETSELAEGTARQHYTF